MQARIILIHDDPDFSEALVECLHAEGHDVRVFDDLTIAIPVPRATADLELAIARPPEPKGGLRIKVIGMPDPYDGPLVKFIVEPFVVMDVIAALDPFLGPPTRPFVERRRRPR